MPPLTSPGVQFRPVRRRGWWTAGIFAAFATIVGALAIFGVAYARQAEKVDDLQAQNQRILTDHKSIGQTFTRQALRFAQQSRKFDTAVRKSYDQGFVAGQEALTLPSGLRPLARQAAAGVLVPRKVPRALTPKRPSLHADLSGYSVRWRQLAVFASKMDSLRVWTRQALGGVDHIRLGRHRVSRLLGPTGVIYAWHGRGTTYAVLTSPKLDRAARTLIAAMR